MRSDAVIDRVVVDANHDVVGTARGNDNAYLTYNTEIELDPGVSIIVIARDLDALLRWRSRTNPWTVPRARRGTACASL